MEQMTPSIILRVLVLQDRHMTLKMLMVNISHLNRVGLERSGRQPLQELLLVLLQLQQRVHQIRQLQLVLQHLVMRHTLLLVQLNLQIQIRQLPLVPRLLVLLHILLQVLFHSLHLQEHKQLLLYSKILFYNNKFVKNYK